MLSLAVMAQVAQPICSGLAIWLLNGRGSSPRWGTLIGLLGQSAWYYVATHPVQWGTLAATVIFTAAYARGIRRHWLARPPRYLVRIPTTISF